MNELTKDICKNRVGTELYHWELGEKLSNHKYISRELVKKTSKGNVYKYVYDTGKRLTSSAKSAVSKTAKKVSTVAKKAASKVSSTVHDVGRAFVNTIGSLSMNRVTSGSGSESKKTGRSFLQKILSSPLSKILIKPRRASMNTLPEITTNPNPEKYKYLAKLKYPDGTVRYIYNKEQWEKYSKVLKYQIEEPWYFNSLPEIRPDEDGNLPSASDDVREVNDKPGTYRDVNCLYCTLAYEMRRRGYDVEAKDLASNQGQVTMASLYKGVHNRYQPQKRTFNSSVDPATLGITAIGQTVETNQGTKIKCTGVKTNSKGEQVYSYEMITVQHVVSNSKNVMVVNPMDIGKTDPFSTKNQEVASAVSNKLESLPAGARGDLSIRWNTGSGHSIAWEVDSKGKVHYYDTQINKEIKISEYTQYMDYTTDITLTRTDNLELSSQVLKKIQAN